MAQRPSWDQGVPAPSGNPSAPFPIPPLGRGAGGPPIPIPPGGGPPVRPGLPIPPGGMGMPFYPPPHGMMPGGPGFPPVPFGGRPSQLAPVPIPPVVKKKACVWKSHKAEDGEVYYYNTETKETTWDKPADYWEESEEERKKREEVERKPVRWTDIGDTGWQEVVLGNGDKYYHHKEDALTEWDIPEAVAIYRKQEEEEAIAKEMALQEELASQMAPRQFGDGEPAVDDQGRDLPQRIEVFLAMLREHPIPRNSTWDSVRDGLLNRPEFDCIRHDEDKAMLFMDYQENRGNEGNFGTGQDKEDKKQIAIRDFAQLLEDMKSEIKFDTTQSKFATLCRGDKRYSNPALPTDVKDEMLRKVTQPLGEARLQAAREAKIAYTELINESKLITPTARWGLIRRSLEKDPRFGAGILSNGVREQIFYERQKELKSKKIKQDEATARRAAQVSERERNAKEARDFERRLRRSAAQDRERTGANTAPLGSGKRDRDRDRERRYSDDDRGDKRRRHRSRSRSRSRDRERDDDRYRHRSSNRDRY